LQKRHVLTPTEELTKKQMQKEKLAKKDKMAELIRTYRDHEHATAHWGVWPWVQVKNSDMPPMTNPLAAHIQTIKRRLLIIAATVLVFLMVAFAFSAEMVAWLNRPFPNPLVFYGPTEALFASIKVSFLAAVLASLPVVFYQLWKFVQPALLPKEQRWGIPILMYKYRIRK
jgi:hypothetical protein